MKINYKFSILVFILCILSSTANAEYFKDVIITGVDSPWTDSRISTTLQATITLIGASEQTILINQEEGCTDLTIPSNISLKFTPNGSINNTGTLTFQTTNIQAGDWQIFKGTGDIDFVDGTELRSSWFEDGYAAFNITNGQEVSIQLIGTVIIDTSVAVGDDVTIESISTGDHIYVNNAIILSNIKNIIATSHVVFVGNGDYSFKGGTLLRSSWFNDLQAALTYTDELNYLTIDITENETISVDTIATKYQHLNVIKGPIISIDITKTLTIASFEAGLYQVFDGDGTVVFGAEAVVEIYPTWWENNTTPGTTDMTDAVQAAVNASTNANTIVRLIAGQWLITDEIELPNKTQISGDHTHIGSTGGTLISFEPTTVQSLFVPATAGDTYLIENLYIAGNSTAVDGNSIYAINVHNVHKSLFRNLRIHGFRTPIRCYGTIMNRFEFVHLEGNYIQDILYDGGYSTTDVWDQCYIYGAPIGVQTNGYNLAIRFQNCIFETLETYGVNLVKESYGWSFVNTYVENVPIANVATNAMFRIGYDGSSLSLHPQAIISGGFMGGKNGAPIGSLIDVDFTSGVILGGFHATRYINVLKTSANTQTNQIVSTGWTSITVTNQVTDSTKIVGIWPEGVINSGQRNNQNANLLHTNLSGTTRLGSDHNNISVSGSGIMSMNGTAENFIPYGTALPTGGNGSMAIDSDASTNGSLYAYSNGAWRKVIDLP